MEEETGKLVIDSTACEPQYDCTCMSEDCDNFWEDELDVPIDACDGGWPPLPLTSPELVRDTEGDWLLIFCVSVSSTAWAESTDVEAAGLVDIFGIASRRVGDTGRGTIGMGSELWDNGEGEAPMLVRRGSIRGDTCIPVAANRPEAL